MERLHDEGLLSCSEDESEVSEDDSEAESESDEEVSEGEGETEGESEFGSESVHDYFSYSTSYPTSSQKIGLRPEPEDSSKTLPLISSSKLEEIEAEDDVEAEVTR